MTNADIGELYAALGRSLYVAYCYPGGDEVPYIKIGFRRAEDARACDLPLTALRQECVEVSLRRRAEAGEEIPYNAAEIL